MIVDNQRRTSQIVAAYVRKNLIPTDQIAGLINSVHSTLSGLGNEVVEESPPVPAVSVRRSVRPDYIICIDCGYQAKMLKRHLQSGHGLSVIEYKRRWNLSSDYPMTAPNYSEQRAQFAKKIGLGRTPPQPAALPAAAPATTTEKPARRSAGKATRSRTSAKKASAKKASAKKASAKKASAKKASAKKASAKKASAKKASPKTSARKASRMTSAKNATLRGSTKKAGSRPGSSKPSSRASKARSAPEAATA
jgi:predicted transcriptional regulator